MIATYSIWQIGLVWILGSFLLGFTWCLLVRIEVYLNRRERRAALRAAGSVAGQSGERSSTAHPVNAPQRRRTLIDLEDVEWEWLAPYRSPLTSGRTRERRHRR